jgi:hypothetical protein
MIGGGLNSTFYNALLSKNYVALGIGIFQICKSNLVYLE